MVIKRDSLSKNFFFQFFYQGLILIIPLILSPYLTRVLQETALGIYSYVNSIAYYFLILCNLGISRHGQRIVSKFIDDEINLRKAFWSLFTLHLIISVLVTLLYFGYISLFVKEDYIIYLIESLYVASAIFDITWLFYGLENFKNVVIRNGIVKLTECVLIFSFVKNPADLWIYTLICGGGILIGQIIMIPQAIKIVKPIQFSVKDFKPHIEPLLIFSIAIVAATLYTVFDKTLLGILSTKENVAFYEYSNRIISVPKVVISVIGTVMYPRACKLAAQGDVLGQKKYINYSLFLIAFIGIGSIFGLFAIADLFAIVYYGKAFSVCGKIIITLSPLIFIIGIGDVIRTQFMIPNGLDKQFSFCIIMSGVANIILSVILIPEIGIYGAVIGTITAEVIGLLYQLFLCRKFITVNNIINISLPFVFIGFVMYSAITGISSFLPYDIYGLVMELIVGAVVYLLFTMLYIFEYRKDLWLLLITKLTSLKRHL